MNIVKIALLRLVARNIQSLVDFIGLLDKRFDDFVAQKEQTIAALDQHEDILAAEYRAATDKIATQRDAAIRDANIAKNFKAALPTGTTA